MKSQQINQLRRDAWLQGENLLPICKAFIIHLAGQETPHGSALKKGRIKQMAPPLPSEQMLARRCYRCDKMSKLDRGPALDVPSPSLSFSLSLFCPNQITFCFPFLFHYPSLHLIQFHHPILTTSQRLATTFAGQLKGRQHSRRKLTYFLPLGVCPGGCGSRQQKASDRNFCKS